MVTTETEPISSKVAPPTAPGPGEPTKRARRSVRRWLLDSDGIAAARAALPAATPVRNELMRRAQLCCELARRLSEDGAALRYGSTAAMVAAIYLEAAYWALLAARPDPARPAADTLWEESATTLQALGYTSDRLDALKNLFVTQRPSIEFADLPEAQQLTVLADLRELALRTISAEDAPLLALQQRLARRAIKLGVLLVVLIAVVWGGVTRAMTKPNLALGKPWRTSSVFAVCNPSEQECGGVQTKIFFHTVEENSPWFEYDLGAPVQFSSLTVRNRTDDGQSKARAVPLIAEVSNDQKSYREIARQTEKFRVWSPHFAPQRARYIRLRVGRKSILHLEDVQVHP
jgi:hypothetical protein